ncbi:MAG: type III ribulose-bisphosphate carboxylase [Candidatus Altiarchaeota archaeon]
MSYIDLKYAPDDNDMLTLFYIEPSKGISFPKACEHVTGESSIGTWTDVSTMKDEVRENLQPHVYWMDEKKGLAKIAYPLELFEPSNVPQIMSSIAGNIYGMKAIENLRLLDIGFPRAVLKAHKGPHFGVSGVREVLEVSERPLVGTIVKPKVGLDSQQHADVAYGSWLGGCDIVKDDENLTDQPFNRFEDRVIKTLEARDKAYSETGEQKVYMANITAETSEMIRRMEFIKDHGGRYAMIDVVTLGFSAVQTVRMHEIGLVLHAHRAMHAALTRNKSHGITMLALAKIYRMIGVDQLHIGTAVGKMEGPMREVMAIRDAIVEDDVRMDEFVLPQKWYGMKPVFPVSSGGMHAGIVPPLMDFMGKDVIIQAGGGVHGHPDGTVAGAKSMRQAVDAVLEGVSLEDYARDHEELRKALKKFGK